MKTLALIAHDKMKPSISDWAKKHKETLKQFKLYATSTTGDWIRLQGLDIISVKSGPMGGDQQIGAMIVEHKIDGLIFLWDAHSPQAHDVDVKALLRIAVVYNIPMACNLKSADSILKGLSNE